MLLIKWTALEPSPPKKKYLGASKTYEIQFLENQIGLLSLFRFLSKIYNSLLYCKIIQIPVQAGDELCTGNILYLHLHLSIAT